VKILALRSDDTSEDIRGDKLAHEVAGAKKLDDNLRNFVPSNYDAAVLADDAGLTAAIVSSSKRAPLPDELTGVRLHCLHLNVVDVEVAIERQPQSRHVAARWISGFPSTCSRNEHHRE
jgi:hypothetical protein